MQNSIQILNKQMSGKSFVSPNFLLVLCMSAGVMGAFEMTRNENQNILK